VADGREAAAMSVPGIMLTMDDIRSFVRYRRKSGRQNAQGELFRF
jgi:hypothetical protein